MDTGQRAEPTAGHPDDRVPFILADGSERYYDTAWVRVRLNGKTQFTICGFGIPGTQPC